MINEFIKEYKQKFEFEFSDDFKGNFEKFFHLMLEPRLHQGVEFKERLNSLSSLNYEPICIAIVGQFSSGKSSFLNAILKDDILPTGVVPVTAKPTYIKYAPKPFLMALYKDKREEILEISELANFVDQRLNLNEVLNLTIFLPNPLLKRVNFVDTPGLNSRSDADTKETLNILDKVGGLIWISLIDNAARKSELLQMQSIPQSLKKRTICLLNQKDKLSDDEIKNVLKHAKEGYDKDFELVFAISAKFEKEGKQDSGFDEIEKFIHKISSDKESFIKSECQRLVKSQISQYDYFSQNFVKLEEIFTKFDENFALNCKENEAKFKAKFRAFFDKIKQSVLTISKEIETCVKMEDKVYYKHKKSLFSKENYEKFEYKRAILDSDNAISRLIYNSDSAAKIFKNLKRELDALESEILLFLEENFSNLENSLMLFKGEFRSIIKSDELYSDEMFADFSKLANNIYGMFLSEFEKTLFEYKSKLSLFFDKIAIKIITNYENAIKLSVFFLSDKCERSSKDYESDPLAFALYFPKLDEINKRVLTSFNYYEFEDEFSGDKPFVAKFLSNLRADFANLKELNLKTIKNIKDRYSDNLNLVKSQNFV